MKTGMLALVTVIALGGCVAVPAYPPATYGPVYAPSPAVGVYVAPPSVRYHGGHGRHGHRHGHWR